MKKNKTLYQEICELSGKKALTDKEIKKIVSAVLAHPDFSKLASL